MLGFDEATRIGCEKAKLGNACVTEACAHESDPNCYYYRSDPTDVARTERLTFICPDKAEDAGPTNNYMAPQYAKAKLTPLYRNATKGRTMYVIRYVLTGPFGSP